MVWRLNGALYRWLSGTQLKWSTDTKNTNSVSRSAEEGFTVSVPFTQCPRRPEVTLSPLSGELSEAHTYNALAEFIKHLAEGRLVFKYCIYILHTRFSEGSGAEEELTFGGDRTLAYFVSYLVGSFRAH